MWLPLVTHRPLGEPNMTATIAPTTDADIAEEVEARAYYEHLLEVAYSALLAEGEIAAPA